MKYKTFEGNDSHEPVTIGYEPIAKEFKLYDGESRVYLTLDQAAGLAGYIIGQLNSVVKKAKETTPAPTPTTTTDFLEIATKAMKTCSLCGTKHHPCLMCPNCFQSKTK